jgi:hypothetical protein
MEALRMPVSDVTSLQCSSPKWYQLKLLREMRHKAMEMLTDGICCFNTYIRALQMKNVEVRKTIESIVCSCRQVISMYCIWRPYCVQL